MQQNSLNPKTIAFGYSAIIVIIFNSLLTIIKERFETVHEFLVTLSGHHWITHGILDVVLFFILGAILSKKIDSKENFLRVGLLLSVVVGVFMIALLMLV